ncbi:MAG: hypothetical protein P8Q14_04060 [Vicingaceae bacterium]|nr:hypothetical protein [Vicingaceae bacterium]
MKKVFLKTKIIILGLLSFITKIITVIYLLLKNFKEWFNEKFSWFLTSVFQLEDVRNSIVVSVNRIF